MSKIIVIDVGHGGTDSGAVNGPRYEKNDNLKLALEVKNILQGYGQTVYLTRETDTDVSLNDRPNYANDMKADYFLSLHRNSFSTDNARGVEMWVYSKSSVETIKQAETILNEILRVNSEILNRGVKKGYTGEPNSDYAVNRISTMPSALLELMFISNPNDNAIFDKEFYNLAKAIADGLMKALGQEIPKPTPPKPQGEKSYIVKAGDSFWKIASEQMGDGRRYPELAQFNGLSLSAVIYAGQVLKIPSENSGIAQPTETISQTIKQGDKVKVRQGAKTYTGGGIADFVYNNTYTVDELKGNRAVVGWSSIRTPFNVKDLVKV